MATIETYATVVTKSAGNGMHYAAYQLSRAAGRDARTVSDVLADADNDGHFRVYLGPELQSQFSRLADLTGEVGYAEIARQQFMLADVSGLRSAPSSAPAAVGLHVKWTAEESRVLGLRDVAGDSSPRIDL
ncbi:hypothetical protein GCM10010168_21170 [Actinoplanes ianthinogenes]|uniref:Uncharacterized protein n=1 Tax=Actinoplanes ianthinogenes TaxID=122358 RepID=A0ABN6CR97_9ACTN|nr:hypothetical protein [Actinoplanes ianthinogenes]BCJ47758.1 hypothetical protein Aiant_84150 [Actinoplanes ianthinogenes]GGR03981.1 hypothetical protein GCM10010168_21170 [Actinoplanes ianthinogenes]